MLDEIDYNRKIDNILEPSAGKGDIIEFMKNDMEISREREQYSGFNRYQEYSHNPFKGKSFNAIELDPELQANLRGKPFSLNDSMATRWLRR
jgi:hypothetical protein